MKVLLVSAGDEAFMPTLRKLMASLSPDAELIPFDFSCFDLGMCVKSQIKVSQFATQLKIPNWDLPVSQRLQKYQTHLRALTVFAKSSSKYIEPAKPNVLLAIIHRRETQNLSGWTSGKAVDAECTCHHAVVLNHLSFRAPKKILFDQSKCTSS